MVVALQSLKKNMDYTNDHHELTATTTSWAGSKWGDYIVDELMRWVREAPLDTDAASNAIIILREYDKQKTTWQRIKCLFL